MMLSERIYALRRKHGMSQEQLAEKAGVSRQAVSKWETGQSMPELEKLMTLARCFGITIDELLAEQPETAAGEGKGEGEEKVPDPPGGKRKWGLGLCLLGGVLFLLAGAAMLWGPFGPAVGESSVVTVNGFGLLFLLGALLIGAGAFLIGKRK